MKKAILVIDMPDGCRDCHFCYYSDGKVPICYWKDKVTDETKPNWCPLKELPEKYDTDNIAYNRDYSSDYECGYNACIDEILGGK